MASILVIDDEPAIRKVVASALAHIGCETTFLAEDAESGLELIKRQHPDIVISDVKLPGISGVELAHTVKSDSRLKGIRVLLMSAFGEPSGHEADGFIAKPFDLDDLTDFVDKYMR